MKWCNVNFQKVEDICNGLASGVARSSIPRLPLRSPLVFHLSSRDLFLASFSEGHSSYSGKMVAGGLSLLCPYSDCSQKKEEVSLLIMPIKVQCKSLIGLAGS